MADASGTFLLEEFDWRTSDRLEVRGRWNDFWGPLEDAALVVRVDGERRRLPLLGDTISGGSDSGRRWRGEFAWEGERAPFDAVELDLGSAYVDLPPPRPGRRRFGRQLLAVRARARAPVHAPADPATLLAALTQAQEAVTEAEQAARRATAEATRARDDARRAREARGADARRLDQAVAIVRELRDGVGAAETEGEALKAELAEARTAQEAARRELEAERGRTRSLREELDRSREAARATDEARQEADTRLAELAGRLSAVRRALYDT